MRRRDLLSLLGGAAVSWPVALRAQQPAMPVIGFLAAGSPSDVNLVSVAFRQGLKDPRRSASPSRSHCSAAPTRSSNDPPRTHRAPRRRARTPRSACHALKNNQKQRMRGGKASQIRATQGFTQQGNCRTAGGSCGIGYDAIGYHDRERALGARAGDPADRRTRPGRAFTKRGAFP
jgi:hypothetical protein